MWHKSPLLILPHRGILYTTASCILLIIHVCVCVCVCVCIWLIQSQNFISSVITWERSTSKLNVVILITQLICRVHHAKCWTGWSTDWNQDCREKYQWPQICRWHHPNGRKQRGIKYTFDEDERVEWESWLKIQHSKKEDHGIQPHHFMANRWGNNGSSNRLLFSWAPKSLGLVTAMKLKEIKIKLKDSCSLEEKLWQT